MEIIRVYSEDSTEYKKLEKAARILTAISPKEIYYCVTNVYFDFGQDWLWTTICAVPKKSASYQALCPRDFEKILHSDNLLLTVDEIIHDKYWSDKEVKQVV